MKKVISTLLLVMVLMFSFNSFAGTCYGCYYQKAGDPGTWKEGSCFDGGSSCGIVCLYCDEN